MPKCHVRTLYVCFPRSPQGFPLRAFLPMTFTATFSACAVTVVIFGHLNRPFTYLLTSFRRFQDQSRVHHCRALSEGGLSNLEQAEAAQMDALLGSCILLDQCCHPHIRRDHSRHRCGRWRMLRRSILAKSSGPDGLLNLKYFLSFFCWQ